MIMTTNLKNWLVVALFLVTVGSAANAKTIYVDADANGSDTGTNWANAYPYLQDALADADTSAKPVEVRVARGTYTPDSNSANPSGSGDRTATFQLINDVNLKGGYAGDGEADPNARDIDNYETILSGDLDGNDVQVADPCDLLSHPNRAENSYHVVTGIGTDVNAVLDGFTITAGNANETVSPNKSGGGLYGGSSTVLNCTFVANSASSFYGAMYCAGDPDGQKVEISDCNFTGNWCQSSGSGLGGGEMILTNCQFNSNAGGSAFYSWGYSSLTNCVFNSNTSDSSGGGIYISGQTATAILSDCIFINNTAEWEGGGIYNIGTITLTNCTFIGNSAKTAGSNRGNGGGMYTSGISEDPILINCTFIDNSAAKEGGGMHACLVAPTLVNCTFAGNHASTNGGGVSLFVLVGQISGFTNCVFTGNTADNDGGGFYSSHDYTKFTNCTFTNNQAGGDGGGYCLDDNLGTVDFNNCIFWGNTAYDEGPQIAIKTPNPTVVTVSYCDVQGGEVDVYIEYEPSTTLDWGSGNIDEDPLFVDADGADNTVGTEDDNLRLTAGSPCIDVGDNNSVPVDINDIDNDGNTVEPFPWDLDGRPRIIDGDCNDTDIVDMGAYEFGWLYLGDFAGGCDVDFVDFAVLGLTWLKEDGQAGYDPNCDISLPADSLIDEKDLKILTDNWLSGQ